MPANVEILISSNAQQAIQEAKKMQAEMDALKKTLKEAGVSQSAYNQAVAQQQKAQASASQATKSSISDLASLAAKYVSVGAAITAVVGFTKDAINTTMAYAREVRDLAMVSGTSAEEASRLLQVLDDFEVSAEDVTAATRMMTKQGLAPTIDTLASLSDQYIALNSAEEKNQFILDNLGRSGLQWVNVLSQGGDALRQMGTEVNGNLILTDQNIQATEEYRLAMDNMGDSVTALKMTLAKDLLPTLQLAAEDVADLTDWVTKNYEAIKYWGNIVLWITQPLQKLGGLTGEWLHNLTSAEDETQNAAEETKNLGWAVLEQNRIISEGRDGFVDYGVSLAELQEQARQMTETNRDFLNTVMDVSNAHEKYRQGVQDADAALAAGKITAEQHAAKIAELAGEYNKATNQIVADLILMQMTADGSFTTDELNRYLDALQRLGIITADDVVAAKGLYTQALLLDNNLQHTAERADDAAISLEGVGRGFENAGEAASDASGPIHNVTMGLGNLPADGSSWTYTFNIITKGRVPNLGGGGADTTSSTTCFVAGTPVTMADGSTKPIEAVQIGDAVLSYDTEAGETREGRIVHNLVRSSAVIVRINGIQTTPEHPFWAVNYGAWVKAGEISVGDTLQKSDGTTELVTHTETIITKAMTVYNLTVDECHTYFAGGVLVHNKTTGENDLSGGWTGGQLAAFATGGKLGSRNGWVVVGDAAGGGWTPYTEAIDLMNGTIYNARESRILRDMGVLSSARHATLGLEDMDHLPGIPSSGGATPSGGLNIPRGGKLNGDVVRPTSGSAATIASVSGMSASALSVPTVGSTSAAQAAYAYQMQQAQQAAAQTGLLAEMNSNIKKLVGKTATANDIAKSSYEGASKSS